VVRQLLKERGPNQDKVKDIYTNSKDKVELKGIVTGFGILNSKIKEWNNQDKYDDELKQQKSLIYKRYVGC